MSVSPMMTAASPMTIAPVPKVTVAVPMYCEYSAPESAMSALEIMSAIIFFAEVFMPCARAIFSFAPVARMDAPNSVPKNQ